MKIYVDERDLPPIPPQGVSLVENLKHVRASLGRQVAINRIGRCLSKAELARRAGIRREVLSRIEGGKVVASEATLRKIDAALATRSDEISKWGNPKRSRPLIL